MNRRLLAVMVSLFILCAALLGCGAQTVPQAIKMTMVTDLGGINDESFNALAWKGCQQAASELGFEVDYIESGQQGDYAPNLERAVDAGAKLIWGVGFMMADDVKKAAINNPDVVFGCIDHNYSEEELKEAPNLIGISFREQEPSFLVGVIAGRMTKTNKIGFVGGMEGDVIGRFHAGFEAGVKLVNPNVEFIAQYCESFIDVPKGKSIATKMYQDGCDIVFHAAGAAGNGVISAADEMKKWVIGVDSDQNYLAPECVVTSSCKSVDTAIIAIARQLKTETIKGGNYVLGIKENAAGIAVSSGKLVPPEILKEVSLYEEKIKSGELVIPSTTDAVQGFLAANK